MTCSELDRNKGSLAYKGNEVCEVLITVKETYEELH